MQVGGSKKSIFDFTAGQKSRDKSCLLSMQDILAEIDDELREDTEQAPKQPQAKLQQSVLTFGNPDNLGSVQPPSSASEEEFKVEVKPQPPPPMRSKSRPKPAT